MIRTDQHSAPSALPRTAQHILGVVFVLVTMLLVPPAHSQSFRVLYNFTGGADGGNPLGRLVMDGNGNIYGTARFGGPDDVGCAGCGTVFMLSPNGSDWVFSRIYAFKGLTNSDGQWPTDLILGPDTSLYGTTEAGGKTGVQFLCGEESPGCGTVFKLTPVASDATEWQETVLFRFSGWDGYQPSGPVADQDGTLYLASSFGGADFCNWLVWGCGFIYQLSPFDHGWEEIPIFSFTRLSYRGAFNPASNLIFDAAGNLFGTTASGGYHAGGTAYELRRTAAG